MRSELPIGVLAVALLMGACEQPPAPVVDTPVSPGVAAEVVVADGRRDILLEDLEAQFATARTPACVRAKGSPGGGTTDTLVDCYREVAEAIAIEQVVLAGVPDLERALEELDDGYIEQRNAALLGAYYRQLSSHWQISEDEIKAWFQENRAELETPRQFSLFNIFRRHRDSGKPDETVAFLKELKTRIEVGETFAAIAREYSESETRLRDGVIGQIAEPQLPESIRAVTARLEDGEISEPVLVKGGAVLLKISGIVPAVEPELERYRETISRTLVNRKNRQAVESRITGREPPPGAVVLTQDELLTRLDAGEPGRTVFDLGGQQLTVAEFRRIARIRPAVIVAELPAENRDGLFEAYQQLTRQRLLLLDILESGDTMDQALLEEVEQGMQQERLTRLVDDQLKHDVWQWVDENPAALERFFNDNRHHYQSPLKFKLQVWHLPFDANPAAQAAAMERMRIEMEQGDYRLVDAVGRLGGEVENLDWREFSELDTLPVKARTYLLQAKTGGFSIPYQHENELHMIWVEAQQAPEAIDYADVALQVRDDYHERFERRLYQGAVGQRLDAAGFRFHGNNVRRWFAAPFAAGQALTGTGPG